jgi:hypothetical protein
MSKEKVKLIWRLAFISEDYLEKALREILKDSNFLNLTIEDITFDDLLKVLKKHINEVEVSGNPSNNQLDEIKKFLLNNFKSSQKYIDRFLDELVMSATDHPQLWSYVALLIGKAARGELIDTGIRIDIDTAEMKLISYYKDRRSLTSMWEDVLQKIERNI